MPPKPRRRTRERIVEESLALFNAFGEPNVTTQAIADRLGISPGNLYYHFKCKDEILAEIFSAFSAEIMAVLAAPTKRRPDVEDMWLLLHLVFEIVGKYRFLYRDVVDLVSRNRTIETRFRAILGHALRTTHDLLDGLAEAGDLRATKPEIEALAVNMVLVTSNWLSFEFVRDPRKPVDESTLGRGIYQVMAMIAPLLEGDGRRLFERLARRYVEA